METSEHTPGPWQQDWQFIVAPDPNGIHPDIYIAEMADEDSEGRVASPEQQEANGRLIVAAPDLLAACRMVIDRWEQGDLAEAARACQAAVTLAADGRPPWGISNAASTVAKRYSVLLLYPDYVGDEYGKETYYAFVEAADSIAAIVVAQRQAVAAQVIDIDDPTDFAPLLVTRGHHYGEPLLNK